MKPLMLLVATLLLVTIAAQSSEDNVLQLLADLKRNAELEVEGIDLAWQRRLGEKQALADQLANSLREQRAECQNKQDDVDLKTQDIDNTTNYIQWMLNRQRSNLRRIDTLEANICRLTNNFVKDISNYKIVLALVTFLRQELARIDGGQTSLAEVNRFNAQVSKFVKLYNSGKLLSMVQKIEVQEDGSLLIPDIRTENEVDQAELLELLKPKVFAQLRQEVKTDTADSAVVLVPGCDNNINTVVVVQNDNGSGSDGDVNVSVNTGTGKAGTTSSDAGKHDGGKKHGGDSGKKEDHGAKPTDHHPKSDDSGKGDDHGHEHDHPKEDEHPTDHGHPDEGSDTEDHHHHKEDPKPTGGDDSTDQDDESGDESADTPADKPADKPAEKPAHPTKEEEEELDFKRLLEAIEKHTKQAMETAYNDEVRTSMGYIDFKLHIELENTTFDRNINFEQEYQAKQKNMLTARRQSLLLCGARLKQIDVAYQIALKDIDAARQFYEEQRRIKVEEVNTFDDVYRIYVNQVKN